jgi:VWFA-related protein
LFPAVAVSQSAPVKPQSQSPADDVIRVNTELVQTDVTVVDKKGRLVHQLTASDFELIVEGKPQEIVFFERVVSSRANNEPTASDSAASDTSSAVAAARVRTVLFFVDDLHLSAASLEQTRKALLDFVTNRME